MYARQLSRSELETRLITFDNAVVKNIKVSLTQPYSRTPTAGKGVLNSSAVSGPAGGAAGGRYVLKSALSWAVSNRSTMTP